MESLIRELVKEMIKDIRDIVKTYGRTLAWVEMYKKHVDVKGFVKPREKTVTIYVSKYCKHCESFLQSPAFPLLVDKANQKGYSVVVSRLDDEKSLEEAMNYGLTNVPVAIVKRNGREETVPVDKVLEVL